MEEGKGNLREYEIGGFGPFRDKSKPPISCAQEFVARTREEQNKSPLCDKQHWTRSIQALKYGGWFLWNARLSAGVAVCRLHVGPDSRLYNCLFLGVFCWCEWCGESVRYFCWIWCFNTSSRTGFDFNPLTHVDQKVQNESLEYSFAPPRNAVEISSLCISVGRLSGINIDATEIKGSWICWVS